MTAALLARPSAFAATREEESPEVIVPRDQYGRPLVVPEEGGKPIALTRTTTFVDCIEDKSGLTRWHKRMTMVGAAKLSHLLAKVRDLDPQDKDDKKELDRLAERLFDGSGANDKREKGTELHLLTEYVDAGKPLPVGISDQDRADMLAYHIATMDFDVKMVEQFLVMREIESGGTTDRVLFYDGPDPDGNPAGHLIGDTKTGTVEWGALKMAMQLGGYSRGRIYDFTKFPVDVTDKAALKAWKQTEFSPEDAAAAYTDLPDVNQKWGVIINLPAGTGTCEIFWVDLEAGYKAALLAKEVRAARKLTNKVLRPFKRNV